MSTEEIHKLAPTSKSVEFYHSEGYDASPVAQIFRDSGWCFRTVITSESDLRSDGSMAPTLLIVREEDLVMSQELTQLLLEHYGEQQRILVVHDSPQNESLEVDEQFCSVHHIESPLRADTLEELLHEISREDTMSGASWSSISEFREQYRLTSLEHHESPCSPRLFNYLRREGIDENDFLLLKLELVFQEAIANAFEHGNLELKSEWREILDNDGIDQFSRRKLQRLRDRRYSKREILVSLSFAHGELCIEVEDQGPGFNVEDKMKPDADGVVRCHGRGLALMNLVMDSVSFSNGGRKVCLKWSFDSGEMKNGTKV